MAIRHVYRVTGGGDPRRIKTKEFIEYGVHVYEYLNEVKTMLYTLQDGKKKIFNKLTDVSTQNSLFVYDLRTAYTLVYDRITKACKSIGQTNYAFQMWEPDATQNYLYQVRFQNERFKLEQFLILGTTPKAWKIEREKGRNYIYPLHKVQPHNPLMPYEEWTGVDLIDMKVKIGTYAGDRLHYLDKRIKQLEKEYDEYQGKGFE